MYHYELLQKFICDHWAHFDILDSRVPFKPVLKDIYSSANFMAAM